MRALGIDGGHCLNAATNAGDWLTAYDLFRRVEPRLRSDAILVVCLSDYWLEGGPASALELLPRNLSYLYMGEPAQALASFVPLSFARGGRMRWIHDRLDDSGSWLTDAIDPPEPLDPAKARIESLKRLEKSNVDAWYADTDDATREKRRGRCAASLQALARGRSRVVLLNLPNPLERERYVDLHFPTVGGDI